MTDRDFPCADEDFPCDEVQGTFAVTLSDVDAAFVRGAMAERGQTEAEFCSQALINHAQW